MRNLKRALSLTLASVMLLGMMVVGSSAAAGYDDVSETDNVEAIEVLQAIEVMVGDERGFGPERPVNRAEMAVVMGKLLNLDYNYYSATCPFDDVYDWARGWVGACAASKIVSGRGEGIYDPGATVTAVEAASMLMRALGYFQYQNDYQDGFEVSTVRMGKTIGIFDNVGSSASEPMTRNQVAQMVLNALQCGMVEPDGNTINLTTPDGTVLTGKVNYVKVTSNKAYAKAISSIEATSVGSNNDSPIVELGEQLYNGKLTLDDEALDVFKRPARHWEYDGKDIGTYMKKELLRKEYTAKVTGKDLYEELTKATIDKYDFVIAIDGETEKDVLDGYGYFTKNNLIRSNTEGIGKTGNGVLTQVFVDPDEGENGKVYIAVINTYLAKANADYNEKKDEVTYTTWKLVNHKLGTNAEKVLVKANDSNKAPGTVNLTVSGEDFDIADVKDGDIVLVQVADGEIQEMFDPEIIDEVTLNSFKRDNWVRADGTQYDYASAIRYDTDVLDEYDDVNMKETQYRIYLDKYGYAIGIEIIEEPDQYVFLTGIDLGTSNLNNKTAEGNVIHMDGTMDTVKINMDKSLNAKGNKFRDGNDGLKNELDTDGSFVAATEDKGTGVSALMNTWCRYAVDKNGVYTLTEVANSVDTWTDKSKAGQGTDLDYVSTTPNLEFVKLDKSHIYLNGIQDSGIKRVYTNDDTVFLTVDTDEIVYKNLPGGIVDGKTAVIISDVESVGTGHQNVNLDAWNAAQVKDDGKYTTALKWTSNGVYNLFDDDGFVIAAVVVGEDAGTSTTYAYILNDDLIQEDYDADKDEWTWYREAVVNGEVVKLTEKGETNPELGDIGNGKGGQARRGEWHEVKYKADGTVRSVKNLSSTSKNILPGDIPVYDFDGYEPYTYPVTPWDSRNGKYICDVKYVEAATDQFNTILLWDDLTDASRTVSAEGHSLWVKTNDNTKDGFSINPSAKTVLIQDVYRSKDNNHLKIMGETSEYTGGITGVKQALKEINKDNDTDYIENEVGNFRGFVGAVFENGMATSIVIYDKTASYLNQGSDPGVRGTYTLTLKGNLIDKIKPTSVEYILDGKRVEAVGVPYGVDAVTGGPARVVYEIPAIATGVVVYDADIVEAFDGWLNYDNHAAGTKDIRVIATPKTSAGGSATLNFDLKGNLTLNNVPTATSNTGNTYTLTLTGTDLSDKNKSSVWSADGKTQYKAEEGGTIDGAALIYEVNEGDTVLVKNASVFTNGGTFKVTGGTAVVDSTKTRASVKVDADVVMDDSMFASAARSWTVVFEEGVTPVKWLDNTTDMSSEVVKVSDNTYQVPQSADVDKIQVESSKTSGALVTNDATCMMASNASSWTVAKGAANNASISLNTIDKGQTIYVYAASEITLENGLTGAEFSLKLGSETTVWARPGVTLTAYADGSNGDGIIVQYGDTVQMAGFNPHDGKIPVDERDITLRQGFKVTLNGVTAVVKDTGETVESGMRVAKDKNITIAIEKKDGKDIATTILSDMSGNYKVGGTTVTPGDKQVSAKAEYTAVTKITIPSGETDITVTGKDSATGMNATIAKGSGGSDVEIYVVPGEEIGVDAGTNTIEVKKADGTTDLTEGVIKGTNTAKITVGGEEVKVTYTP